MNQHSEPLPTAHGTAPRFSARPSGARPPARRPALPARHVRPGPTSASRGAPAAYRHDLDGLRALAVVLVAIYHVWVHRVSGGVDVFLMLSGFFVGGGLLRSFARGTPVRLRTYVPRLARRLLPALAVVLAAVLVASATLLPRTRWTGVSGETLASLLYVENWRLAAAEQAYGAADATQSPLQHVWSLSVQGQLFVGLPVLLLIVWWLAGRAGVERRLVVVHATVVVLAVASFVHAALGVRTDQAFTYYDTFARAWEYLAGMVLAVVVARVRLPGRWAVVAGWAGLVLVVASGVLVDGGALFPGPATLVPLAGAALVVVAGTSGGHAAPAGSVSRLLGRPAVARAGGYAYAFYLWHWPVLVFAVVVRDRPVGWLAGTAVLLTSAALAVATKHLVEDPVRSGRRAAAPARTRGVPRAVPVVATAALVLAVAAVPTAWLRHVDGVRSESRVAGVDLETYPGALSVVDPLVFAVDAALDPIPDVVSAPDDKVRAVDDGCGTGPGDDTLRVCSYGDLDAARVIAVVGGSHAEQWIDALAAIGEEEGFRVDTMIRWGCSLIEGTDEVEHVVGEDATCPAWSERALDRLERDTPDVVFTTATRPAPEDDPRRETVPAAYLAAWLRLADSGVVTVAIRDNPWLPGSPVDCVAVHGTAPECAVERATVLDDENPLVALDAETPELVRFVDVNDVICADDVCAFVQGGRLVYRDGHHLTATYVESLAPVLRDRLEPVLGWW